MSYEAYPLHWPTGRPRTETYRRERAKFDVSFARARDNIVNEVKLLAGGRWATDPQTVISTNIALRRDGLPAPAAKTWRTVLDVGPHADLDGTRIAYRALASQHHPNRGGDSQRMAEINKAWAEAQAALGA